MTGSEEGPRAPGLVRAYVISGGVDLADARRRIHLDTSVTASGRAMPPSAIPEKQRIRKLVCGGSLSVTEIAGYLRLPVGVIIALLADMLQEEYLECRETAQLVQNDVSLLKEVLHGLRAL